MPKSGPTAKAKGAKMEKEVNGKFTDGTFHGYAATWDVDSERERFVRGAFAKSIMERVSVIPAMIRHFRDGADVMEQIGMLTGAHEDEIGVAVSGKYLEDELSQSIRGKVKAGVRGLSVGYKVLQDRVVDGIREITEAVLLEVTITNRPTNKLAGITHAKSDEPGSPAGAERTRRIEQQKRQLSLLEVTLP